MKTANKITLPRGYLSHAQIDLVLRDPKAYIKKYIYGENGYQNKYMDFGKIIAETLDGKNNHSGTEAIGEFIPKYPKREIKIACFLKRKNETLELRGVLDGWNPKKKLQGEYKSGLKPWNQDQVNKNLQLKIYALIHWKNYKEIPSQELTWVGTENHEDGLRLTGDFKTFVAIQSMRDILETEAICWKAYGKILALAEIEYGM